MNELGVSELVSIGRFARLSGLSVKALRHYDEIGLLLPARVDEASSYRYYTVAQARVAEAIRRLRSLQVPLAEVRALLDADEATLRERLAVHRARIEGRAVETRRILAELDLLIDGKETLVPRADKSTMTFEMKIEHTPARRGVILEEHGHESEMSKIIPRQIETVHAFLQENSIVPAGAPFCVCPFPDAEGMLTPQTGWFVEGDVTTRPPLELREFPAARVLRLKFVGPYEELGRAYRLLAEAMEANGLEAVGDPLEIYWSDPAQVADPRDYVTVIEWPIGPKGELSFGEDVFTRRAD